MVFHLQLTLFLLLVFGYVCARVGIITKEGRKGTDGAGHRPVFALLHHPLLLCDL